MNGFLTLFFQALCMVGIAEMGDKTQLVVIALTKRYRAQKVALGMFLAILADNLIAVILGRVLATLIEPTTLSLIAGALFLYFAITSVRAGEEETENTANRLGPVFSVALTFFLAEFGDKTQLSAANLAATSQVSFAFLAVLLGATAGMLLANLLALIVGVKLGKCIPDHVFRWVSVFVFAIFGAITLYQPLCILLGDTNGVISLGMILVIAGLIGWLVYRNDTRRKNK
ncbi:MAG: TMEM165/GDT1 family protein [Ruminococcaceae bacterium]|nr:TMEM165/GDT1 family protein [Oscillospiraceae bacterium]